ncbi:MAG: hypothetical protein H6978_06220 [Gammaproteobacteria bacterium]|nr:hypothetical protein [Gammaproteobacteria bacterium]
MTWTDEAFYSSGDPYFDDMLAGIAAAHRSVRFETYIFEKGVLGDRMIRALTDAMHRGCEVTLMVDGIGAPDFRADYGDQLTAQALPFNIYHPAPWARFHRARAGFQHVAEKFAGVESP